RGVNVFPSQIESVLLNINQVSPYYQLIVTRKGYMDLMEVQVELADAAMLDQFQKLQALEAEIRHKLRTILGLDAKVRLVEPKSIERTTGKAKHVIDLRNGGN
ncbi:MAG: phenylacetate--CoA ligase, partial [Clostridia bacterium]